MYSKLILIVVLQIATFEVVTSQCLNRVMPGCAQNIIPGETLLPNPLLFNPLGNQFINQPSYIPTETIIPSSVMPTTTIIQDSTVANNLANALQLLVVSNLLANTLPCGCSDVVVPGYGGAYELSPNMLPMAPGLGYNYIY